MIFSTCCSGNRRRFLFVSFLLLVFSLAAPAGAEDSAGNRPEPLRVKSLLPDRSAPQAAEMATVKWEAVVTGGAGPRTYAFVLSDGTSERTVQEGPEASWSWSPQSAGTYRVKVVARDSLGNVADRVWASDYEITPAFGSGSPIAVMPVENLSGSAVPLKEIRAFWAETLKAHGVRVLEERVLEEFLVRHRVRYTGGMPRDLGEALRQETGARGILFVSLDLYEEPFPPKVAFTARLVYAGEWAGILWMDGIAMTGIDSPGILGIGTVRDPRELREKAITRLAGSLEEYISGKRPREQPGTPSEGKKRFRPKEFYRSPRAFAVGDRLLVVAVLPFRDERRRRNVGQIMMLQFVRQLAQQGNVEVVEPGVVREALLTSRTIMEEGLSFPQSDLLRELLGADLVLAGWVMDYQDSMGPSGSPKIRFSTEVIDLKQRQVTWSALSYGQGDDAVYFFGAGQVTTAHRMASLMVREVVARIMRGEEKLRAGARK